MEVVGGLVGSLFGADATENAADAQAGAVRESNALQDKWMAQNRADNMPALEARNRAIAQMEAMFGQGGNTTSPLYGLLAKRFTGDDLQNDPGYQFTRDEGMRGIQNTAAARGGLYSGSTLKALSRFNTGLADQTFGNAFNRDAAYKDRMISGLGNLGGLTGGITTNSQANQGQAYNNMSQNALGLGNVNAAAGLARGNIWGNAINQGISAGQRNNWWGLGNTAQADKPYWE